MKPEFFDIHCHLDFPDYKADFSEILSRMKEKKVGAITVGVDLESSKKCVEIAENSSTGLTTDSGIFASIGMHPTDSSGQDFNEKEFEKLVASPKVVAIGECGLDYFHGEKISKEKQKEIFKKHIEFAIKHNKPLMLHLRSGKNADAYNDALEILNSYFLIHNSRLRGNCHFFAGSLEQAKKFIDIGFTISFTGVITFARNYDEIIKNIPLEKIMAETDAPFVAPIPYRGKRNEPVYVEEVVKKIAEIRNGDYLEVKNAVIANSKRVFGV